MTGKTIYYDHRSDLQAVPSLSHSGLSMILIFMNPQWVVEEKEEISQEALDPPWT